tara:strand:+ start:692 stop:1444 length:753 start_codon:yes stop_codon:yes gene_type:complete
MLYYGGSTFGWNGVPDYADPKSAAYDAEVEPLIYYQDFYGHYSMNIPAAWRYRNMVLTSVHPEADNCTIYDCPRAGTIPTENILQNRAWLATYINEAAKTNFSIPSVPIAPVFDTTRPHSAYPKVECMGGSTLFCDSFDGVDGTVPAGLWQWQRNQTTYNFPVPWNVTFISEFQGYDYGTAANGAGFAICVPKATTSYTSTMITSPVAVGSHRTVQVSFMYKGTTPSRGELKLDWNTGGSSKWTTSWAGT